MPSKPKAGKSKTLHPAIHPEGAKRPFIEYVRPEIECGRHAAKGTLGDHFVVDAAAFVDGHDELACVLLYRHEDSSDWTEVEMCPRGNDEWVGQFLAEKKGTYFYTVETWIDRFQTWAHGFAKKFEAGQDIRVDLQIGVQLLEDAASRAQAEDRKQLQSWLKQISDSSSAPKIILSDEVAALAHKYPDRSQAVRYGTELRAYIERERARFSSWYEFFPRSCSDDTKRHGTFKDCEKRLAYVARLGFDVIYLPPIHPIGTAYRKGKNNSLTAQPGEPGSPWAIGAKEGGHKAILPELGTLEDFRHFIAEAKKYGIEIALDIAYQCSPDHPYVKEHPEWFKKRPDGTIQYAENPPKKYQDVYPFDFETEDWEALWEELKSVMTYWIEQGVMVFRVDNPHTKSFRFWEWAIREIKRDYPDVIFLSEAFTRPHVMYHLAKIGFTQSYTYFTWRETKKEFIDYMTELTRTEVKDFFRPNFWPNTPDILPHHLQSGDRAMFMLRFVLAATLAASYGMYGPAYELLEHKPMAPGKEEYLDSEKYEIRAWNLNDPRSIKDLISRVNRIRRENPALQRNDTLRFHPIENDQLLLYSKTSPDRSNVLLIAVNLDPKYAQAGWTDLDLNELGLGGQGSFRVHDLLTDARYDWSGSRNFVQLNPQMGPAHIFKVERHG